MGNDVAVAFRQSAGGGVGVVNQANLQDRLAYFERRLEEARRRSAAKEAHPRDFDAGYTTATFRTWGESIAVIKERIAGIQRQLRQD
jgi:hypothetical protein